MPLSRARKPVGSDLQLYRRFTWGQQATFNVLDGRQYRSDQIPGACTPVNSSGYCADVLRPDRTMLGAEQRAWLFEDLATTKARWNVIAQQTGFAPRNTATDGTREFAGRDNWDGYVAERQQILDWLVAQGTPNPVVLTGDSHQHWLRNVPPHYSSLEGAPVATEFMGASVSTGGDRGTVTRFGDDPNNPHILFQNNNCGYVRCTPTPELWTTEYRTVAQVSVPESPTSTKATFVVENGHPGAVPAGI
jgi:alkaline phosphatase D